MTLDWIGELPAWVQGLIQVGIFLGALVAGLAGYVVNRKKALRRQETFFPPETDTLGENRRRVDDRLAQLVECQQETVKEVRHFRRLVEAQLESFSVQRDLPDKYTTAMAKVGEAVDSMERRNSREFHDMLEILRRLESALGNR